MSTPLDQHTVAALIDTRFPNIREHHRTYQQAWEGHWLVKFSHPQPHRRERADVTAAGIGWLSCCYVHATTGEIRLPDHPDIALPVGYSANSVPWSAIFPTG